jgi:hypothetical protein
MFVVKEIAPESAGANDCSFWSFSFRFFECGLPGEHQFRRAGLTLRSTIPWAFCEANGTPAGVGMGQFGQGWDFIQHSLLIKLSNIETNQPDTIMP